jgi:malate dehydrogenase (oxaloacetate-decarboxylating)
LIGTTGQPGDFTPAVIQAMAAGCERPIILPLSNPTSKAECTPSEIFIHSEGRALVATGSPFEPVQFDGHRHVIGQCNNVFVFPGVGLGVLICEASRVTDAMFLAAAQALAEFCSSHPAAKGCLYPSLRDLREVSRRIAFRVAQTAREQGVGSTRSDESLMAAIDEFCWFPDYGPAPAGENERVIRAGTGRSLTPRAAKV